MIRVGHFQCECAAGDIETNVAKILKGLDYAESQKIQIMTFPESLWTGYFSDEAKARKYAFSIDGPEVRDLLTRTKDFSATFMVGFNERRGDDLYNTVLVAERGKLLGYYSKAFVCYEYFTPGREFPVFERDGVKFGVVICADGGYIEPTRILALKGAQIVFAPHYNYIKAEHVVPHFAKVRHDHAARAVENDVYFMRCNNVVSGQDTGIEFAGIGYGDSYLVDPHGDIITQSRRHEECFLMADIPVSDDSDLQRRTRLSAQELGPMLVETISGQAE